MSDLQKKEILKEYFTDEQLDFILSACVCKLSEVCLFDKSYHPYFCFPYLSLTSDDLAKILSFGLWFVLSSDSLYFVF